MPEPEDFECSKNDEFFISIAKQGTHSFMMLGVVKDGSPKLIARVGKTNDIDPDRDQQLKLFRKELGDGTLARLADERISRERERNVAINYQAYAINYEQVKEFLALIAEVEKKQLNNKAISDGIISVYGRNGIEDVSIKCYVPVDERKDDNKVIFQFKILKEYEFLTVAECSVKQASELAVGDAKSSKKVSEIVVGAQKIQISNNCRTTALNMVEAILGFATDISKYFFVAPKYQTRLNAGQPDKDTFYILPSPPTVFKDHLTNKQFHILIKLYNRMEEIPKSKLDDPKTRAKFDALKATYKDIAGENNLSANALLEKITKHERTNKNALFDKRSPGFFSNLFSLSSSTERMFTAITQDLNTEKDKEESKKNNSNPGVK